MKLYKITQRGFQLGLGDIVKLTKDQYSERKHQFELIKDLDKENSVIVAAKTTAEFKVGEIIGLDGVAKPFAELVETTDPQEQLNLVSRPRTFKPLVAKEKNKKEK